VSGHRTQRGDDGGLAERRDQDQHDSGGDDAEPGEQGDAQAAESAPSAVDEFGRDATRAVAEVL
jgi:hypothetical protein